MTKSKPLLACEQWMLIFLAIFPIFDAISGMTLEGKISYGQTVLPVASSLRIVFIGLLLVIIMNANITKNPGIVLEFILFFSGAAIFLVQKIYLNYSFEDLFKEFNVYGKYVFWFSVFTFFYVLRDKLTIVKVEKIILFINITFLIGLFVPYFLGTGTATYDGNAGFKGWYYGPNDSSYTLITVALLNLQSYGNFKAYLLQVANIAALLLLGTKTSMLAAILIFMLMIAELVKSRIWFKKILGIDLLLATLLIVSYFQSEIYLKLIYPMVNRLTYFYYKYNGDLTKLIFSGRSTALTDDIKILNTLPNKTTGILFGYGYDFRANFFPYHNGLIEFDMADVLFSYGLIGLLFLLILISFVLFSYHPQRKKYLYFFLFSLLYSNVAGHVLFSAMSGTILGIIAGSLVLNPKFDFENRPIKTIEV